MRMYEEENDFGLVGIGRTARSSSLPLGNGHTNVLETAWKSETPCLAKRVVGELTFYRAP